MTRIAFALILLAAPLFAADPPAEAGKPEIQGTKSAEWMLVLKVANVEKGTGVVWDFFTEDGRQVGEVKLIPISREAAFAGPKGKYNVRVRLVKGEDVQDLPRYPVELTAGVPLPPVVPPVVDKLTADLKAALKDDPDAALAAGWAAVYADTAALAATAETWGRLFEGMLAKAAERKVSASMLRTQSVGQAYLKATLPWKGASETRMEAADREKAKAAFEALSKALAAAAAK